MMYGKSLCFVFLISEEKKNLAFMLLPVILGGRSKGKGGGRCTVKDSIEAFIDLKPVSCYLPSELKSIHVLDK